MVLPVQGHNTSETENQSTPHFDAVFNSRLSRRALCALGLAGTLTLLAGCSETGQKELPASDGTPRQESSEAEAQTSQPGNASDAETPAKGSTFAYNTLVSITAYGVSQDAVNDALKACAVYEDLFSARKSGTDIDRINKSNGEPTEVDPKTARLLEEALVFCDESEGAFDITIGSVSLLWDFVEKIRPLDADIQEGLKHIDFTKVKLDGTTVTLLDPKAKLDLGGIAKGWICKELAGQLKDAGAASGLIDLGTSSIYAFGKKPDGSGWRIALRDPRDTETGYAGILEISDTSMTSSGLYEQEFELDGVTYWHILDSSTGYPAQTDMLGDTLVCDDASFGDAVTTMLFIKGISDAEAWLEANYPDARAMFIPQEGEPVFVNGFDSLNYTPVNPQ